MFWLNSSIRSQIWAKGQYYWWEGKRSQVGGGKEEKERISAGCDRSGNAKGTNKYFRSMPKAQTNIFDQRRRHKQIFPINARGANKYLLISYLLPYTYSNHRGVIVFFHYLHIEWKLRFEKCFHERWAFSPDLFKENFGVNYILY